MYGNKNKNHSHIFHLSPFTHIHFIVE